MADDGPDHVLVERVQRGDKAAFDLLVLKYQHKLVKLISRYVRDHSEVLDVAQESFLKAYRAMPKFRGDSAFYTWLYRIAINTAKNHLVSQSRRPPNGDVDSAEAEQLGGESEGSVAALELGGELQPGLGACTRVGKYGHGGPPPADLDRSARAKADTVDEHLERELSAAKVSVKARCARR